MTNSYKTGTVSVTNGSAVVNGTGTAWSIENVFGGRFVRGTFEAEILSVQSNTQLTLDTPFVGTTGAGQAYRIWLQDAQAASNITINRQLGEIIARLVDSAPEIQDFLDADTVAEALATIGANNSSNQTTGTLPDGRLPLRLAPNSYDIGDWNNVNASGFWKSARQMDGVLNTPMGATSPFHGYYWHGQATFWSPSFGYVEVVSLNDVNLRFGRWIFSDVWGSWFECSAKQTVLDARYPRKPQVAAGNGQFIPIAGTGGATYTLPSGGSWLWWGLLINSSTSVVGSAPYSGVSSGGTTIMSASAGYYWIGLAWRIS